MAQETGQASAEIEVTPAMVRAFQRAYLEWENSPKGWAFSVGLQRILGTLLREAGEDVRALVCTNPHADREKGANEPPKAREAISEIGRRFSAAREKAASLGRELSSEGSSPA